LISARRIKKRPIPIYVKFPNIGALKTYLKFNNCLPSRIIVYRDGVGDGQLHSVVNYEVSQIMDPFYVTTIDSSIAVMARCPTLPLEQLWTPMSHVQSGMFRSLLPYIHDLLKTVTIFPHYITRYDFYIVSQAVQTGSVSPTHYNVVFDISGLKPDHMQRLTYKMCHLYYNWQGIIRVPAPCQYAHKLAFLVGQSIHRDPSVQLGDLLFYL
uniref:Piwi-like protein 1 n=1 Tax=Sphaeramia orbicularis TaxID=375764 RepID=A0A673CSI2_9TELE